MKWIRSGKTDWESQCGKYQIVRQLYTRKYSLFVRGAGPFALRSTAGGGFINYAGTLALCKEVASYMKG